MKTLSNAELQDAIRYSTECVRIAGQRSNTYQLHLEQLVALLDEQRRRASERVEITLEPMTTTLDRAEFDARVRAQGGPEWVVCEQLDCPVDEDHDVEVLMLSGKIIRGRAGNFDWAVMGEPNAIDKYRDWTQWEQSK